MMPVEENDKSLKLYLLGGLETELREQVEERLLTEDEFFESLLLAEDELVDDYLRGGLTGAENLRFETLFLTTPERIDKVRFARALHHYAATASYAELAKPKRPNGVLARWRSFGPVLRASLAAGLPLVIAGAAWLSWERLRQEAPQPVSIVLTSGLLRGTGSLPRVDLSSGARRVELRLELAAEDHGTYRVTLEDATGNEVFSQSNLKSASAAGEPFVGVTLPSTLLPQGDYTLRLIGMSRPGDDEVVATYVFRVPAH